MSVHRLFCRAFLALIIVVAAIPAIAAPPDAPSNPSPANGVHSALIHPTLTWTASDPDGDPLTYDVYLGPFNPPPLVASGLTSPSYLAPVLDPTTPYLWRVVAHDPFGGETSGPQWLFTTRVSVPPGIPQNPSPANGAVVSTAFPVLTWTCTDPDDQLLSYDVYFGEQGFPLGPPLVATVTSPQYSPPGPLVVGHTYYWNIHVWDGDWGNVSETTWYFTVIAPLAVKQTTWGGIKALFQK